MATEKVEVVAQAVALGLVEQVAVERGEQVVLVVVAAMVGEVLALVVVVVPAVLVAEMESAC